TKNWTSFHARHRTSCGRHKHPRCPRGQPIVSGSGDTPPSSVMNSRRFNLSNCIRLRPARANALNDDVVNDRADARREFRSQSGCFLLLVRADKPPQIDGAVLNRDGEHHRPPWLRSQPRHHLLAQLGIIHGHKGRQLFGRARQCLQNICASDDADELVPLDDGYALDSVALQHRGDLAGAPQQKRPRPRPQEKLARGRQRRGARHLPQAHYGIAVLAGLRRQAAIAKCKAWTDPIHTKSVRGKWLAKPASIPTTESSGHYRMPKSVDGMLPEGYDPRSKLRGPTGSFV